MSKYMAYVFLRNDKNIKDKNLVGNIFYSLGDLADRNKQCNAETSRIYSYFWYSYLFGDKVLRYNCSLNQGSCTEITSKCIDLTKKDKSCTIEPVMRPPCENKEQSRKFKFEPCCDIINSFSKNFEASLKLMKYSIPAIHFQESVDEEKAVFFNLSMAFEGSSYILKPESSASRRNFNNFIPLCQYAGNPEVMKFSNCNLFKTSLSNMGLSFSFNTDKFWNIYERTYYTEIFNGIMSPNLVKDITYPDSSGPDYRLRFLLNGKV